MVVGLPKNYKDDYYEIAVSRFIRMLGYFTENKLVFDPEKASLLEIDTVATPASEDYACRILIEAKSGKTGADDIFKIYGWKTFLGLDKACIIRKTPNDTVQYNSFSKFANSMQMEWIEFDLENKTKEAIGNILKFLPEVIDHNKDTTYPIFCNSFYQGIAERNAVLEFQKIKKDNYETYKVFGDISNYSHNCNLSFFEKNSINRVLTLYRAYTDYRNILSDAVDCEEKLSGDSKKNIWDSIESESTHYWLQYVSLLQHRSRISIIKAAVDIIYEQAKQTDQWTKMLDGMLFNQVPCSFQKGYQLLKTTDFFYKVPYFFELFLEVFGGFYIRKDENDEEDFEIICSSTGLTIEQGKKCFEIYDVFFPMEKSWFFSSKELQMLKFVPELFHGIGSFLRKDLYGENWQKKVPNQGWLCGKWFDNMVTIIGKDKTLIKEQ